MSRKIKQISQARQVTAAEVARKIQDCLENDGVDHQSVVRLQWYLPTHEPSPLEVDDGHHHADQKESHQRIRS